jgi:beta-lactamase superfamily II metal-dependent hydrolase/alpha-beta hydrolase superfamily lysophospholipase
MYLFDVGCQLSFLAIAALIWLVPPTSEALRRLGGAAHDRVLGPRSPLDDVERYYEPRWRKRIRAWAATLSSGVLASTVVWLSALPLVALRFHIVSPIGILLNIPLIPITSTALLLGGLGLGLSAFWGPLGVPVSRSAGVLLDVTQRVVLWGAKQPWGYRFAAGPSWGWVAVFYLWLGLTAVAATSWLRRRQALARVPKTTGEIPDPGRLRRLAPCLMLAAWSLIGWVLAVVPLAPGTPEADVLAVGHGLAVVLQTPSGRVLLYDCGRMGDPSVGRRIVAPALWSRGVSRIDEVILSHADQDHFNGLPDLLDRFAVGVVRIPTGFGGSSNPAADRLLAEVRSRGIPIRPTAAPESWEAGGIRLEARHPKAGWFPAAPDNARSLVMDVEHRGRRLLLTGDLEGIGLFDLIARPRPESAPEVMLAPHHGGRSANPASLYEWARPRSVVVSQRAPRTGSADALTPLERREVPLWRTWRDGAIRLRWTDGGIVASGFLGRREPPDAPSARQGRSTAGPAWPLAFIGFGAWPSGWRLSIGLAGFLIGLILWGVVTVVEFGAWTLVVPPRVNSRRSRYGEGHLASADHAVAPRLIEAEASDGVRLAGRWYPVQGHAPTARTVFLLHGFAEDPSAWEAARASILNRHGWNVAALDSRGYGRSGGLYASFGGREAGDVSAWLDAIAGRLAGNDGAIRFAIWGRSMGAAIALRAAADDRRIGALVLESPMVDLDESVAGLLRKRGLRFTGVLARLITRRAARIAGVPLARPRPVDVARQATGRTLIVHGAEDWLVTPAAIRRLADAFPSPPDRIEVAGAGHSNVVGTGGQELIGRIADFLDEGADDDAPRRNREAGVVQEP